MKWLERQSTVELAALFDLTEEINTDQLVTIFRSDRYALIVDTLG